jgi:Rad3-related DNA helicase
MTTLTTDIVEKLRQRRSAGEPIKTLASEVGMTWQRLWGLLTPAAGARLRPSTVAGSLTERYRPTSLDAIWGQDAVVKVLRKFAANPYSTAFIFEGETGTGKTSAALALASAMGCDLGQKEFGGVQAIASGEQSADTVRSVSPDV